MKRALIEVGLAHIEAVEDALDLVLADEDQRGGDGEARWSRQAAHLDIEHLGRHETAKAETITLGKRIAGTLRWNERTASGRHEAGDLVIDGIVDEVDAGLADHERCWVVALGVGLGGSCQ